MAPELGLNWKRGPQEGPHAGTTGLFNRAGEALLLLGFQCYVQPVGSRHLLVWKLLGAHDRQQAKLAHPVVRFSLFELGGASLPLDLDGSRARLQTEALGFITNLPMVADHRIPASLEAGRHQVLWPPPLDEIEELLVLSAPELDDLSLWIICPKEGTLEVVPQDWFNEAPMDFMYQWVTRVARDPKTGSVYGEGIRINPFVLDPSNRRLVAG